MPYNCAGKEGGHGEHVGRAAGGTAPRPENVPDRGSPIYDPGRVSGAHPGGEQVGAGDDPALRPGQFIQLCRLYGVRDVLAAFAPAEESCRPGRVLPLYRLAVSAGTGEFLDGEGYVSVEVGEEVSSRGFWRAHCRRRMEPRFVHGQIIWVHRQETLSPGRSVFSCTTGRGTVSAWGRTARSRCWCP